MPLIQPGKENAWIKRFLAETEAEIEVEKAMFKDLVDGDFQAQNPSEKPMLTLGAVPAP